MNPKLVRVLAVSAVACMLLLSTAVFSWQTSAQASSELDANGELFAASGSNRFVVWQDDTPGNFDIFFRRSTDNGATWKSVVNLSSNPGSSHNSQIAVSGSSVYVVWSQENAEQTTSDIFIRRSTDNGASWGSKINLSDNAGFSDFPLIRASSNNVYVAWEESDTDELFFVRSTDGGSNWDSAMPLTGDSIITSSPPSNSRMAVSGSNIFAVWNGFTDEEGRKIYLRRSTDSGATWKPIVAISTETDPKDPQVAASGSNVYVVWADRVSNTSDDIQFRRSTDNGATWKSVKTLNFNPGDSRNPQLAVSGSNVYVAWADESPHSGTFVLLMRSTNNGATWQAQTNLNKNIFYSDLPQIAASGSNVYVVWHSLESLAADNFEVMLRHSTDNGATWKGVKNLSNSADVSAGPHVAAAGSSVYVIWEQGESTIDDIQFRRSTNDGATWKPAINLSNNSGISTVPRFGT